MVFAASALPVFSDWMTVIAVIIGGLGCLAIQSGILRSQKMVWSGIGLLVVALGIGAARVPFEIEPLLYLGFTGLATAGAVGFVVFREPVHAAVGFAATVLSACGLFFLQGAPFIAAATIVVYAGATIIIFLFVLMFAQQAIPHTYDLRLSSPVAATAVVVLLLISLLSAVTTPDVLPPPVVQQTHPLSAPIGTTTPSTVAGVGRSLFSDYLWTVELAGTVLLVATIGAIAIAQTPLESKKARESR